MSVNGLPWDFTVSRPEIYSLAGGSTGILINNVSFTTPPPPLPPGAPTGFNYTLNTDARSQNGLAGQNNPDPLDLFYMHAIIKINNELYDPSYGAIYADLAAWEAAALAGIASSYNSVSAIYVQKQTPGTLMTKLS